MNTPEKRQEGPGEADELTSANLMVRRDFLVKGMVVGAGVLGLNLLGELPVSAATRSALNTGRELQVVARATDGRIFHTIRFSNSWQSYFGNVNDQESNGRSLRFNDVDDAGIGNNLHVAGVARDGMVWHTIRFSNAKWQSAFGNVNDQESNGKHLRFREVGVGGTNSGKLHLIATDRGGVIWHTIRFSNGTWQSAFGDVNDQESNGGSLRFVSVDTATIGEDLHVVGVDTNGILRHTIRFANGTWASAFGNVNDQESNGGSLRFTSVGVASIGSSLHVTAVDTNGILWHTIRFSNGAWQSAFGDINDQESNGGSLRFKDVDCGNVNGNLHVTGVATNNVLWHTIRFSNSWQSAFGDINNQESNSSLRFTAVGASGSL